MMKRLLVAFGLVAVAALAKPAPATADFSLAIGLPGFGFYLNDPYPPPIVYAPSAYYRPPVHYRPAPVYYSYPRYRDHSRRCHREGGYRHGYWND